MSDYVLNLDDVNQWLESRKDSLVEGVGLADVRSTTKSLPGARADFDASNRMGRISIWISGEVDFEVLSTGDSNFAFFRHEKISSLNDPSLQSAYQEFLKIMSRNTQLRDVAGRDPA